MPLPLRYLGMAVSWIGFSCAFTILFLFMRAILAIGGFCAEGGHYVIQTYCPGDSGWLMPVSVYLGLAAVAIGVYFGRGLGASLLLLAWPILFIGLSVNFLQAGFPGGGIELTGLLLGVMFLLTGAIPLYLWGRSPTNRTAMIVGTARVTGESVGELNFTLRMRGDEAGTQRMRPVDYLVLVPLWLVEALVGVWLGAAWLTA